jgi:hemerythrin superfamily protein
MTTQGAAGATGATGAATDMIELLTSQHREVEQMWKMMQAAHGDGSTGVGEMGQKIVKMLSQHDALETQFLYPELRATAGDEGRRLSEHSLDEHKEVRELLTQVDGRDFTDNNVFMTLSRCVDAVMHHVQEEESEIFPLLRQTCDEPRLMDLGKQLEMTLPSAPTHPHPHTPDSKVGATVAGMAAGLMDKARDALKR